MTTTEKKMRAAINMPITAAAAAAVDAHIEALHTMVMKSLDEDQAVDIVSIPLAGKTTIADYMVIASGTSSRHVKSIAEHVVEAARSCNVRPIGVEGVETGEWILVDLGDVVAHLMSAEARKFYALEKLWSE